MNLSETVFEVAEQFMENPRYVSINNKHLNSLAEKLKSSIPPTFPVNNTEDEVLAVIHELVGNSINYCYWYGKHNLRPNGSSSSLMYECVQNAFFDYSTKGFSKTFSESIDALIELLAVKRFPLLEERRNHLKELIESGFLFAKSICNSDKKDLQPHLLNLVSKFPGYGSDIFLKRASLFFLQLYRRFGWFEDGMKKLHIPADYQVPRLMDHYGIIEYNSELRYEIDNDRLIPKWSQKECEIRSATILVAKKLGQILNWNVAEIDGFFWLNAKQLRNPFHLTVTTDY